MLEIEGMHAGYGSLEVIRGLDLVAPTGKVTALLGGNGTGKTTTMNAVGGLLSPTAGQIRFNGERIDRLPAHRIFAKGIALVAQGRMLFPEMTVLENLEMGALAAQTRHDVAAMMEEVLARFPRLRERSRHRAAALSGGEQQMLATGRALMSRPTLLLLDEPTTGLAPIIVGELTRIIRELNEQGLTILLVEQNVKMALRVSDEVYVLNAGRIASHKSAEELRREGLSFSEML